EYRNNHNIIYWAHAKGAVLLIKQVIILILKVHLNFIIICGIVFGLNMLMRRRCIESSLYSIIIFSIVGDISNNEYFPTIYKDKLVTLHKMISLPVMDIVILSSEFVCTLVFGIVVSLLRKSGYRMF